MVLKKGARILAIDDSSFSKNDADALVVGVIGRDNTVEGIMSFRVGVDGNDSTEKIIEKVRRSRFLDQIRVIAIHGVTLAGLNLIDTEKLNVELRLPVICIVRKKPHAGELSRAIRTAGSNVHEKVSLLKRINTSKSRLIGGFYAQYVGMSDAEAKSTVPKAFELIRLAHIIANGIARGESKGRI